MREEVLDTALARGVITAGQAISLRAIAAVVEASAAPPAGSPGRAPSPEDAATTAGAALPPSR